MKTVLKACLLAAVGVTAVACSRSEAQKQGTPAPAVVDAKPAVAPVDPASVERVPPEVAHQRVKAGQALLVCAYSDEKCAKVQLEGAIPVSQLEARLSNLSKSQEIILYCA